MQAKPFLKWAGGKRRLADQILAHFPERIHVYHEPFLGGGAVFFALRSICPLNAVLSDTNAELINAYQCIRDALPELIVELFKLEHMNTKEDFYRIRALDPAGLSGAAEAARMIFLNRTCFNGLYRVNKKGEFNVPFGHHKNPKIIDEENLKLVHAALQNTMILHCDVFNLDHGMNRGDVVYFDPPYDPISKTSSFTGYANKGFDRDHQVFLAKMFKRLDAKGVHCVLSNSDTPFVRELYRDFQIESVFAHRSAGASADSRRVVSELIISSS